MAQTTNILRDTIERAIRSQTLVVPLPPDTKTIDVGTVIRQIMRCSPEIFWFSNQYSFDEKSATLNLSFNFTVEKRNFYERQIAEVISDNFQPDLLTEFSELRKVAYVYQWIVANTTYNEYSSFNQTIYSVLINRNSVCTGYAKTAQYLLGILGIESQLVFGKLHKDTTIDGRHCWNLVKIEGKWYHVDFCLADPSLKYLLNASETPVEIGGVLWNYFVKPTHVILQDRTIEHINIYPDSAIGITLQLIKASVSDKEFRNILLGEKVNWQLYELKAADIGYLFAVELNIPKRQLIGCKSDSGTTSQIYLNAYNKHSVVKIVHNSELLANEAEALQKLSGCHHCVQFLDMTNNGIEIEQLTPWSELLNSHYYKLTEFQLRQILIQLAKGLLEIKAKGYIYADIHYNNIFVTSDGVYKWGDFGFTYQVTNDDKLPDKLISPDGIPYGSVWFMSPETFRERIYTETSAVYSLSILAYFVMNGMRPPFFWSESNISYSNYIGRQIELPCYSNSYGLLPELICRLGLSPTVKKRISSLTKFINILSASDDIIRMMLSYEITDIDYLKQFHDKTSESYNLFQKRDQYIAKHQHPEKKYQVDTDMFARSAAYPGVSNISAGKETYEPSVNKVTAPKCRTNRLGNMLGTLFRHKSMTEDINACVYAPGTIRPFEVFIVRVYMYRPDESQSVANKVNDIDPFAVRKEYKPLDLPVKFGDKLTVSLSFPDNIQCDAAVKTVLWRGHFTDCSFSAILRDESQHIVAATASVQVNGMPAGEMMFTIEVSKKLSAKTYAKVEVHNISKIFISYAHADVNQVRGIAEGCRMLGKDYFFDRHSLNAGDIFKDKIMRYIDEADLFVLCWSKNAAKSEWVRIERTYALSRIESGDNNLRIYPLSIAPEAPLPEDMSERYNFGRYEG